MLQSRFQYPIFLELSGVPCLVIGGGPVAYRKAKALCACGARVSVVSPLLCSSFDTLVRHRKIRWRRHPFQVDDLKEMRLVVAATNEQSLNERAARQARRKGIFINVVDQPKLCSFIVPSVVRRGRLCLAISTGGASPALSKWIRRDLESRYGREFRRLVAGMARARGAVLEKVHGISRRKQLFEKALQAYFDTLKKR